MDYQENSTELWRPVPGLTHLFEANRDGRVRSARTGRELRQHTHPSGYLMIATREGGRKGVATCYRVHRLVAMAFVPGRSRERNIVHHLNGDRADARAENLAWVSVAENTRYSVEDGTHNPNRGEANGAARLNDDAVRFIRAQYVPHSRTFGMRALAARFGVHAATVRRAYRGEKWRHVE